MVSIEHDQLLKKREELVNNLSKNKVIYSKEVEAAFLKVKREEFIDNKDKNEAYSDTPLQLGTTRQTISAPHMIAIMLENLNLCNGMKVLEIGSGSGYNAALMSEIMRSQSKNKEDSQVITVERIDSLGKFASNNLKREGYNDVKVVISDGSLGYPEKSEKCIYDRIIVTAAAPYVPKYLKIQLKINGILLIPVGNKNEQDLQKITKKNDGSFSIEILCGCRFVPLIGESGNKD